MVVVGLTSPRLHKGRAVHDLRLEGNEAANTHDASQAERDKTRVRACQSPPRETESHRQRFVCASLRRDVDEREKKTGPGQPVQLVPAHGAKKVAETFHIRVARYRRKCVGRRR